jgi:hypothetical protein
VYPAHKANDDAEKSPFVIVGLGSICDVPDSSSWRLSQTDQIAGIGHTGIMSGFAANI